MVKHKYDRCPCCGGLACNEKCFMCGYNAGEHSQEHQAEPNAVYPLSDRKTCPHATSCDTAFLETDGGYEI